MVFFRIKNWSTFQHYKDRDPPWIKLHRSLMQSQTWVMLDDASKALAVACMMIAAGCNNKVKADPTYIKRVAYLDTQPDLKKLVEVDFIEFIDENGNLLADDSSLLADASKCLTRAEQSRAEQIQSRAEAPALESVEQKAHQPSQAPDMPRRNDPPGKWHHLTKTREVDDRTGKVHAVCGGHYLDLAADAVCAAAKIRQESWRWDWRPLMAWLEAGFSVDDVILPAIRKVSARPGYQPPASLKYFDNPVRELAQAGGA